MLFNTVLQRINEYRVIELIFGIDCSSLGNIGVKHLQDL